jgi:hypothetical protein
MDEIDQKYADKYWDMANAITAFTAAQSVVFSVASATADMHKQLATGRGCLIAIFITLIATALYLISVCKLHRFHKTAIGDGHSATNKAIEMIALSRIVAITWFQSIVILCSVGPYLMRPEDTLVCV